MTKDNRCWLCYRERFKEADQTLTKMTCDDCGFTRNNKWMVFRHLIHSGHKSLHRTNEIKVRRN